MAITLDDETTAELMTALRGIVERSTYEDRDLDIACVYCKECEYSDGINHKSDCAVTIARRLLGKIGGDK